MKEFRKQFSGKTFSTLTLSLILTLFPFRIQTIQAQPPLAGIWLNQQAGIQLQLGVDGSYLWQDSRNAIQGHYQVSGNTIIMGANFQSTTYQVSLNQNRMTLTDPNGHALQLQRVSQTRQPPQPQSQGTPSTAQTGMNSPPGSEEYFLEFLESYQQLGSDPLVAAYQGLNQNHISLLNLSGALASQVYLIMCQGSYANQVLYNGMNCQALYSQYQQTLQFGVDPRVNAEQERMQLVTVLKCTLGLIDQGSCRAYMGAVQNYNTMANDTSQTIIDNMGSPSCTQYYDQSGGYLGCW